MAHWTAILSAIVLATSPGIAIAASNCDTMPKGPERTDCYLALSRSYQAQSDLAAANARAGGRSLVSGHHRRGSAATTTAATTMSRSSFVIARSQRVRANARPDDRLRDEAIQTAAAETVWIASLRSQ